MVLACSGCCMKKSAGVWSWVVFDVEEASTYLCTAGNVHANGGAQRIDLIQAPSPFCLASAWAVSLNGRSCHPNVDPNSEISKTCAHIWGHIRKPYHETIAASKLQLTKEPAWGVKRKTCETFGSFRPKIEASCAHSPGCPPQAQAVSFRSCKVDESRRRKWQWNGASRLWR